LFLGSSIRRSAARYEGVSALETIGVISLAAASPGPRPANCDSKGSGDSDAAIPAR